MGKKKALVSIGGRDFTIQKHFLDDIQDKNIKHNLDAFRNSILIMHSPQDISVGNIIATWADRYL